jgi:hypothetical protein
MAWSRARQRRHRDSDKVSHFSPTITADRTTSGTICRVINPRLSGFGGRKRNRTAVRGFAVRCIATLPSGPKKAAALIGAADIGGGSRQGQVARDPTWTQTRQSTHRSSRLVPQSRPLGRQSCVNRGRRSRIRVREEVSIDRERETRGGMAQAAADGERIDTRGDQRTGMGVA